MMPIAVFGLKVGLSLMLMALSLEDLRRRQVRRWLAIALVVVVLFRTLMGMPALGLLFAAIMALGEREARYFKSRRGISLLLTGLAFWLARHDGSMLAVLIWLLALAQWRAGILGGADAQIQMLLSALFPTVTMVWLLLLVPSLIRLLYLLRGKRGRQPMIPAYALAGIVCTWIVR